MGATEEEATVPLGLYELMGSTEEEMTVSTMGTTGELEESGICLVVVRPKDERGTLDALDSVLDPSGIVDTRKRSKL